MRKRAALRRMAAQHFPTDDQLDIKTITLPSPEISRIAAALEIDASDSTPRLSGVSRRRILFAAGATTLTVIGSGVAIPQFLGAPRYAATPPLLVYRSADSEENAMDVLRELAAKARIQPPRPGSGPYSYIKTEGWRLGVDQTANGRVLRSEIEPVSREVWIAADGSGRIEESGGGHPSAASAQYGPGQLATIPPESARLSPLDAITQAWSTQVVSPAQQADLLARLAGQADLQVNGTATDRAGRSGVAVSAEHRTGVQAEAHIRVILIFDAATGMLLSLEEVALEAGDLPVHAPATIRYTMWLASGYAPDTNTRVG